MTDANNMRSYLKVLNESKVVDHSGPKDGENIKYSAVENDKGEITKVVAQLKSVDSGRYTKLGRNLQRIERISARVNQLRAEVKDDTRELIADLFHADDACHTRVVETVGFVFQMTKDPKASTTYKYQKILEDLAEHLTPELLTKLKEIKSQYETTTQKAASLKATDKRMSFESEKLDEVDFKGAWDRLASFCRKFLRGILDWGNEYDAKLDALKAQAAMVESDELAEAKAGFLDQGRADADVKWGAAIKRGINKLKSKANNTAKEENPVKVKEETNPLSEADGVPSWKNPIKYRGYEIYPNPADYVPRGDEVVYHVEGWEPGDPDGETGAYDTTGYFYADSFETAKEMIDDELGEEITEDDWGAADWIDTDEDEEDTDALSVDAALAKAEELLDTPIINNVTDQKTKSSVTILKSELNRYGNTYYVGIGEDGEVNFTCADRDSVNYGAVCASAWLDAQGLYWES